MKATSPGFLSPVQRQTLTCLLLPGEGPASPRGAQLQLSLGPPQRNMVSCPSVTLSCLSPQLSERCLALSPSGSGMDAEGSPLPGQLQQD